MIFRGFGWIPDLPDVRDYRYQVSRDHVQEFPTSVDLRQLMPEIQDQGQLGSCVEHWLSGAYCYELIKEDKPCFSPSRLFMYFNARSLEGTVSWDSGSSMRNGIKALARWGACTEEEWGYDARRYRVRAPKKCYTDALAHQALSYSRVPRDIDAIKSCLSQNRPFGIGFTVYSSFLSEDVESTGIAVLPPAYDGDHVVGGHAVLVVGYEDENEWFIVRNSWGKEWGNEGYFYMPYKYLLNENLSDDFWVIALVE